MNLSYYGFAFFIFMLLCFFALLCRRLFVGNNKEHILSMDEKEKKLLTLYSTMEEMMDEFNHTALAANEEIARTIKEMRTDKNSIAPPAQTAVRATQNLAPAHLYNQPTTPIAVPFYEEASLPKSPVKQESIAAFIPEALEKSERIMERPARILTLHKQGLDKVHIAKQLAVTVGEVDLVLGLAAQKK
ncbi:MAG: hypothetical protein FWG61_06845 [Firmicutes bacterium]|nr:hypothetical protein [Bacillota bacterium]